MAQRQLDTVLHHIRRLAIHEQWRDRTDTELLAQFRDHFDQGAFAALMQRHGRLVLSVCRHVLVQEQDAEDAFQATFLVFARNAGSVRKSASLASWLHGVAYRIAMSAKRAAARRRLHERKAIPPAPVRPPDLAARRLQALVDVELQNLPEKYRAPFVLCCLEGCSKTEAARTLGWKERTVAGRLAQARKVLQRRLSWRGVTLSAALCVAARTQKLGAGAVPAGLTDATGQAAVTYAVGGPAVAGVASARVLELAAHAFVVGKRKLVMAAVAVLTIATAGTVTLAFHRSDEALADDKPAPPVGRIWILEDRSEVTSVKPDGSDRRTLLEGQKMLRWVSPAEKLVFFDGRNGQPPDPIPKVQPDGNPDRGGLSLHIRPLHDKPADAPQREQIRQLIADLDSDSFTVRQKADRDLANFGQLAEPEMRKALAEKPSAEVRQRLQKLLERLAIKATDLGILSDEWTYLARDGRTLLTRRPVTFDWVLVDAVTTKRTPFKLPPGCDSAVDLAPGGSWVLAFQNTDSRPAREREKEGMPQFRLHKVPLPGGKPVLLTGRLNASLGRISPDGKRVLATVYQKAMGFERLQASLYVIDVATQKATQILGPGKQLWAWGEWSPDGRHVACAWGERFDGGKTRVAVCDADGKKAKFILTTKKWVLPIAWR